MCKVMEQEHFLFKNPSDTKGTAKLRPKKSHIFRLNHKGQAFPSASSLVRRLPFSRSCFSPKRPTDLRSSTRDRDPTLSLQDKETRLVSLKPN